MVARALPPERYEPFVLALLASQDRWAFARGVNNTDEISKMAALAGMSRQHSTPRSPTPSCATRFWRSQDVAEKQSHVELDADVHLRGPTKKDRHASGEMTFDGFAVPGGAREVGGVDRESEEAKEIAGCLSASPACASPVSRASPSRRWWRSGRG